VPGARCSGIDSPDPKADYNAAVGNKETWGNLANRTRSVLVPCHALNLHALYPLKASPLEMRALAGSLNGTIHNFEARGLNSKCETIQYTKPAEDAVV